MERPEHHGSEKNLLHLQCEFCATELRIYFSSHLSHTEDLNDGSTALRQAKLNDLANDVAGEERSDECPSQVRAAARFLCEPLKELMQDRMDAPLARMGGLHGFSHVCKLHFGHHAENVVLAFEVIEKGSLANIRGLGDVLNSDVRKPSVGKELKSGAKKTNAGFPGFSYPTARGSFFNSFFFNKKSG